MAVFYCARVLGNQRVWNYLWHAARNRPRSATSPDSRRSRHLESDGIRLRANNADGCGGHQMSWLIDGVPIPTTNIASNLGPQIDPKDIDTLEMQRGSYAADFGDRTYGVFNVAPRTGFERNNEAELTVSLGNFYQTDDQINLGGHNNRFAYYASATGNRTNLGLETPTSDVIHDAANGTAGFASLIYNLGSQDQIRLVTSL